MSVSGSGNCTFWRFPGPEFFKKVQFQAQVHTVLSVTHCTCRYTLYLQVHTVLAGTHCTCRYTLYLQVHIVLAGTHCTCMYTLYLQVHTVLAGTHCTCRYTLYLQVHTVLAGTHCTCRYTLYLTRKLLDPKTALTFPRAILCSCPGVNTRPLLSSLILPKLENVHTQKTVLKCRHNPVINIDKQAGAELCQAQVELGLAKLRYHF
jgi:hypothetical protein